jgi:GNAT superfamily N-acetyltransferase
MSDKGFAIRVMCASDASEVAALTTELGYPADADAIARRFEWIARQGHAAIFVADVDGRPVGWIHVMIVASLESDVHVEIGGLVVDGAWRSQGLGRALVAAAEQWARGAGCAAIRVRSRIVRERAHAFYERQGYQRVKTQHAFEKPLDGPA